ncbi:MAG: MmcQ/YjbR family DNA-binding protein [Alphaproteobacteria bacterium]|nr:MmcQ/YjbR family DNA-binding protein [Alphaproteobacteria bacterium]MDE2110027.1 MmcQ/YjbR family DNA-binding protein [Alphaproteobacteria bacterium]MDE2492959.1 MmcQ/YjbR family DNA-binding protein [Alphaproteobacteria bacterium]
MPSPADVRKIALALDGTTEVEHWGRPAFRTKKRIFAVIRPDGLYLHLPPERKEFLFKAAPQTFVKFMWGKTAEVIVQLGRISARELTALIREAWKSAAPSPKPPKKRVSSARNRRAPG